MLADAQSPVARRGLFRLFGSRLFTGETDEAEFLPAALEIVESPPAPASRLIAGTIILFFTLALAWACIGSVDIIATAPGRIVPTGRTKIIQPLESGVVRAIHVQDAQKVKAGDVLIEIDTTISAAERDRLTSDYMQAKLDAARLRAALTLKGNPVEDFSVPDGASDAQVRLQKTLLQNQVDEIRAKLGDLDHQIAQNIGSRDAVASTIAKLRESIPYLKKRAQARKYLLDKGYGSKLEYYTIEQDLIEHEKELQVQKGHLAEAEASISAHREQRRQAETEYKRNTLKELAEAEQKAASLHEQVLQAAQKYRLQTLTAPVDGTVQQLAVHTEGGVVTPAQALMAIVPADSRLEIEAMVSNRDIGFVRAGQEAEVKIDTFTFTRYGLIHGKVLSVSRDAIARERADPGQTGTPRTGDEEESSERAAGQQLTYSARVSLGKTQMQVDDRLVDLGPGMAVTVEIKTGSRRIIEYLLSPLLRHTHDALREM
ncbi:MAG TPA: HlyD family type I secretion periplasmic adaptor subunit [Bryobacteraceae bacterium]|nr:HlyD family type I secretion periplasmic adaptor subunit [Bryobacteraceae bacterium]